jgi:hypothetical protein
MFLKTEVVRLFGGRVKLAQALDVTPQNVDAMPEELPEKLDDRIVGACLRTEGQQRAETWFPSYFE